MKRTLQIAIAVVLLIGPATPGLADCSFNGRSYPTGTRIGDRICMPDGTWQPRQR